MDEIGRTMPVLLLDAGDMLFPPHDVPAIEVDQRRIKADLILGANETMGIDAVAVGDQDLMFGVSYLQEAGRKHETPFVCANIVSARDGKPAFEPHRIVERAGLRIGVFGILRSANHRGKELDLGPNWKVNDPIEAAKAEVAALKAANVDYIVALAHMGLSENKTLGEQVPGINLIVGGHGSAKLYEPGKSGDAYLVHAGFRGKHLGQLELTLVGPPQEAIGNLVDATGSWQAQERIDMYADLRKNLQEKVKTAEGSEKTALEMRVQYFDEQIEAERKNLISDDKSQIFNDLLPLGADVADLPRVAKQVDKAKDRIAKLPMQVGSAARPAAEVKPLRGPYVGAKACQACHPMQYGSWKQTEHAHAYETLIKARRQFDYDCVGCHTTAYQKDGGFDDPWAVGELVDVQCEVCHGAGQDHAKKPKKVHLAMKMDESQCRRCHSMEQTGDRFIFADYLPKVAHGKPLQNPPPVRKADSSTP